MIVRSLLATSALALLAACSSGPARPVATAPATMAAPAPMVAPAPAPMMSGMDGRYVGTARLVSGGRACRPRVMPVSADVAGDRVTATSGRTRMEGMIAPGGAVTFDGGMMSNTRFENGAITGQATNGECRYDVTLRKAGTRTAPRRGR